MNRKQGKVANVQTGHVIGFENSVNYDIPLAGGIAIALLRGGGLFVTALTGPGKVVLKSVDFAKITIALIQFFPGTASVNTR